MTQCTLDNNNCVMLFSENKYDYDDEALQYVVICWTDACKVFNTVDSVT